VISMYVCLSVCLSTTYCRKYVRVHQISCTCCRCSWLGPALAAFQYVIYFWFVDDLVFFHDGPYGAVHVGTYKFKAAHQVAAWDLYDDIDSYLFTRGQRQSDSSVCCLLVLWNISVWTNRLNPLQGASHVDTEQ